MDITFNVPHVFYPGSPQDENAAVLRIFLDALIRINIDFLHHHNVPHLYKSGVTYGNTEIWYALPALYEMKYGDCKSLTAALIAQYRIKGIDAKPVFRFQDTPDGMLYHILVELPPDASGKISFEDPSKVLGMEAYLARKATRPLFRPATRK